MLAGRPPTTSNARAPIHTRRRTAGPRAVLGPSSTGRPRPARREGGRVIELRPLVVAVVEANRADPLLRWVCVCRTAAVVLRAACAPLVRLGRIPLCVDGEDWRPRRDGNRE